MKKLVIVLFVVAIVINVFTVVGPLRVLRLGVMERYSPFDSGVVSLIILGPDIEINITSPLNQTYNFDFDEGLFYDLDLNVSADGPTDSWWYTSESLESWGMGFVFEQIFIPNETISVTRGSNMIIVWANDSSGREGTANVTFYVNTTPNTVPILEGLDEEIFICEGDNMISPYNSTKFNAVDYDGDYITFEIDDPNSRSVFYIRWPNPTALPVMTSFGVLNVSNEIYSVGPRISKWHLNELPVSRFYQMDIAAKDGHNHTDIREINITIIEINNVPDITNPPGAQTLWVRGENNTFDWDLMVEDDEFDIGRGDLNYNLSFLLGDQIFNISSDGRMNFTANSSYLGTNNASSVYLINVTINDSALESSHTNISDFCGQDGSGWDVSHAFYLVITNENRLPRILDYYPKNLNFSVGGEQNLYFNITVNDSDGGIPDVIWEVNGSVLEIDTMSNFNEFNYAFPCGVGGDREVVARVTDGLNDTLLQWNVSVSSVKCPDKEEGGGGGGGGGGDPCVELWGCDSWEECKNAAAGLRLGTLTGEEFRVAQEVCDENGWPEEICGYQNRPCTDLNSCGTEYQKEQTTQACHFVLNPGCDDGVKNCHDGGCEFLVDCGGPCPACPTCSDGTQNQGEEGIDCGGPCPFNCPSEQPSGGLSRTALIVIFIILVLLIIIFIRIYRIRKLRKGGGIRMGERRGISLR